MDDERKLVNEDGLKCNGRSEDVKLGSGGLVSSPICSATASGVKCLLGEISAFEIS